MSEKEQSEITVLHLDQDGNITETTTERRNSKNTERRETSEEEEENYVSQYRLTDFPEPDFVGEYRLGTDQNQYYSAVNCEGTIIRLNDSVLVLTDEKQNIRKDFMYCAKIMKFWRTPEDKRIAKVNWYWRREEVPPDSRNFLLQRELLLSEKTDEIPVDSIKMPITVYDSPEPLGTDANKTSEVLTNVFFCNRAFLVSRHEFIALSTINRLMKQAEDYVENVEGTSPYDLARAKLQLNYVRTVAGRKLERIRLKEAIKSFLNRKGLGACLYISGVPGTGKTLCVKEVMKELAKDQLDAEIPEFDFYEVNCLRYDTPKEIFVDMWYQMAGEKLNSIAAQKALNDVFTNDPPHSYIILLVDEVDVLLTTLQNELYCLLEWAGMPRSYFIIICIANLMDLDQRLKPKLASRFGKSSVKFYPYKASELQDIINSRVGELDVFEQPAIEYCSKQIANFGGDARKALEACKRAIDLIPAENQIAQQQELPVAEGESEDIQDKINEENKDQTTKPKRKTKVTLTDMVQTIRELQATRSLSIISKLSDNQQIFLAALLMDMRITGRSIVPLRDVCKRHRTIQTQLLVKPALTQQMILVLANQLIEMHIVKTIKDKYATENSTIALMCMEHDAIIALNKNPKLENFVTKPGK